MFLPQWLVEVVTSFFPEAIFRKKTREKVVALTIDDGPTPNEPDDRSMMMILEAIDRHNQNIEDGRDRVRATFFIITGHLRQDSPILWEILQRGHEIGNHGTADGNPTLLTPQEFQAQLMEAHERLSQFSENIRWYRPARGLYNREMVKILRWMDGYEPRFALASMIPLDTFNLTENPHFTAWHASLHVFPGAILVLHGGTLGRSQRTAAALKLLLPMLKRKGYRAVTLSELWDYENND